MTHRIPIKLLANRYYNCYTNTWRKNCSFKNNLALPFSARFNVFLILFAKLSGNRTRASRYTAANGTFGSAGLISSRCVSPRPFARIWEKNENRSPQTAGNRPKNPRGQAKNTITLRIITICTGRSGKECQSPNSFQRKE